MAVLPSFYPGGHGELEPESLCRWMDWDGRDLTGTLHWDQVVKRDLTEQVVSFFLSFLLLVCSLMPCCPLILLCHVNMQL